MDGNGGRVTVGRRGREAGEVLSRRPRLVSSGGVAEGQSRCRTRPRTSVKRWARRRPGADGIG